MLTKTFLLIVSLRPDSTGSDGTVSYIIGGILAFLIMCYLIYTLIRPDKF